MRQVDECLIIQASFRATGAEIHHLNNVICAYRNAVQSLCFCEEDKDAKELADEAEKRLSNYLKTGKIKRLEV